MDYFTHKSAKSHAWTTINSPSPVANSCIDTEGSKESDTTSEAETPFKNYHVSIIEAATRLVAGRKKPTRKRRVEATTAKSNKRHKSKASYPSLSHAIINSEAISIGHNQPSGKGQSQVHEPVKRFLLPTKHSRLNTTPKIAPEKRNRLSVASEAMLDSENENAIDQASKLCATDICAHEESSALIPHCTPPQSSLTIKKDAVVCEAMEGIESTNLNEGMDVDMNMDACMGTDADFDDSYFDPLVDQVFSDIDFASTSSSPNNTSLLSISTTPSQSHNADTEPDLNTNIVTIQAASGVTAPFSAFLRKHNPDQIAQVEYSPIPRLVAAHKLSTCFRVAEALRLLNPAHPDVVVIIELYTIVADFVTINNTQTVRFADLFFPQRPPYISGSGHGVGKLFLTAAGATPFGPKKMDGMICRAIIRSVNSGTTGGVSSPARGFMTVNRHEAAGVHTHAHVRIEAIRKSDWEEIEYVRGIVDPEGVEAEKSKQREKHVARSDYVLGVM